MTGDELEDGPLFGGPLIVGGVMVITSRLKREGYTSSREGLEEAIRRGWLDVHDEGVAINEGKGVEAICDEVIENPKVRRWVRYCEGRPWEVDVIATLEAIGEAVLEENSKHKAEAGAGSNGRWHP